MTEITKTDNIHKMLHGHLGQKKTALITAHCPN